MKMGVRKPSIKKSIGARTTGRATRSVKRAVNPMYGKKGMGWVNDPKKAAYNKVYNKTTVPVKDLPGDKSGNDGGITCMVMSIIIIMIIIAIVLIWCFI